MKRKIERHRKRRAVLFLGALVLALCSTSSVAAKQPPLVMEEFTIPAADPGIMLYVRNKHPQGPKNYPGEKVLLYVHGATYPAETSFDLKLNGLSCPGWTT